MDVFPFSPKILLVESLFDWFEDSILFSSFCISWRPYQTSLRAGDH